MGALVNPQNIKIGAKKYKFNITIVFSFTCSLKINLNKKPMIINR